MAQPKTFDYEIQLIALVEGVDGSGFPTTEEKLEDPILANKLSVHSSEYWSANQSGVTLSATFEVHSFEFDDEEKLKFKGETYNIVRTYNKGELTELVCEKKE